MAEVVTTGSGNTRRVPITRNSLFYDARAMDFDIEAGKSYVEQDMGQRIVLYSVDMSKTQNDALYGEANASQINFLPPIEVPCVYKLEDPELKSFDKTKNLGTYNKVGKLTFSYYKATEEELKIEIKKGDYVGVQVSEETMLYFCINNINPNYGNRTTMYGRKPFYYTAMCSAVDKSEFFG